MPKFSDLTLKSLPVPESGQTTYSDDGTALKVRVSQGGAKTFFVTLDGSGRRHTIGRYGDVTLADARSAARRLRAEKTLGRIIPSIVSLDTVRSEYLAKITVRQNTRIYYERNLARLKSSKLSDITPTDLNRTLDQLGESSRNQALATFRAFFKWCVRRNYLEHSPCDRLALTKARSRDRLLSDAEAKAIWQACPEFPVFGTIVRLLLLTGQRRSEIAALQKKWINTDDKTITLPADVCKNGREHVLPIGALAADLLKGVIGDTPLLFPARGTIDTAFNGWSKSKVALDELCKVENWTLHDLRRYFASTQAKLGTPIHVTEKLLNHISGSMSGIVGIYQRHTYMPEMREAVERYETHLKTLLRS
jgi:integrase